MRAESENIASYIRTYIFSYIQIDIENAPDI